LAEIVYMYEKTYTERTDDFYDILGPSVVLKASELALVFNESIMPYITSAQIRCKSLLIENHALASVAVASFSTHGTISGLEMLICTRKIIRSLLEEGYMDVSQYNQVTYLIHNADDIQKDKDIKDAKNAEKAIINKKRKYVCNRLIKFRLDCVALEVILSVFRENSNQVLEKNKIAVAGAGLTFNAATPTNLAIVAVAYHASKAKELILPKGPFAHLSEQHTGACIDLANCLKKSDDIESVTGFFHTYEYLLNVELDNFFHTIV